MAKYKIRSATDKAQFEIETGFIPISGRPKRGPKPNAKYSELDRLAIAEIKAGTFKSTLEAAKAYLDRFYPDQPKNWSNERRNDTIKNLRRRFDRKLTK